MNLLCVLQLWKHKNGYGTIGQPIPICEPTNYKSIIIISMTLREQIDQIIKSKLSDREKVDELFKIDCKMYTNLGSDSTKTEIEKTKKNSRIIYRAVQDIDFWLGSACLRTQDDKKKAQ